MSDINKFRCPTCDTVGKWKNVDHLRLKPEEMHQCESCGMVTYPKNYKTEEEIIAYYKKDYREAPQVGNLFTGERKLQYHAFNLEEIFKKWKKDGVTKPVIGEVGAAYGMLLNWIKKQFPEAELHGTELTETYKRNAWHEYGLLLADELPKDKKFDLIISYHVLEHQLDPDLKMMEYNKLLKDDGIMYLSCPVWFRDAANSAVGGFDIEYYYHPDHINVWSPDHLEWIIAKSGFKIDVKNDNTYGNTYLLKKEPPALKSNIPDFKPGLYHEIAEKIYKCWQHIRANETRQAIETFPNCPSAWVNHYELHRSDYHKDKEEFNRFIEDSVRCCPNSADMATFCGDILTRYERYDDSIKMLQLALSRKINSPTILFGVANCFRMKARKTANKKEAAAHIKESINLLRFIAGISSETMPQAVTWIYQDQALLPVGESALPDPR